MSILFRPATPADAKPLLDIYSPYVLKTCISFEDTVPTVAEFESRIKSTLPKFPYIVCESNGKPLGYAYAHSYRSRAAYSWGAELSVYVDESSHHSGIGTALYTALIELLRNMNYQTVYGIVTSPNPKSEKLHEKLGFKNCGVMPKCGYKLGQWVDITNFELEIGSFPSAPTQPLTMNDLSAQAVQSIFDNAASKLHI